MVAPRSNQKMNQTTHLSDLAMGDKMWEQLVLANSKNPHEPTILPGWNLRPCKEFYNKAVSYGEQGGLVLPPTQIFHGVHPNGAATTPAIQQMQRDIWTYLGAMNPGVRVLKGNNGGPVGLACSMYQCAIAFHVLRRLELEAWFQSVLAHGKALSGPLATLYLPRHNVSSGLRDPISVPCELWM